MCGKIVPYEHNCQGLLAGFYRCVTLFGVMSGDQRAEVVCEDTDFEND